MKTIVQKVLDGVIDGFIYGTGFIAALGFWFFVFR
jgi:hypothetical protein